MKTTFSVAILGAGGRGYSYAKHFTRRDEFTVVSACDLNPKQLDKMQQAYNIDKNQLFTDEQEFFEQKRADILV
ncbi:MAG: hypothetical protein IKY12_03550, partial [Clostridia bacterium]|nr:hypothetical protein [Clostridia bacterium]